MLNQFKKLAMIAGAVTMAITTPLATPLSAKAQDRAGPPRSKAKPNVNRPPASANRAGGQQGNKAQGNKSDNKYAGNNNRPNTNNRPNNNRPGGGGSNNIGNTVVVAPPRGGGGYNNGYYDNGRHYSNNDWDDDDNDFLEFVGKTAAITAGVSVVAAVIGSTTNEKPSGCQETMSNGQVYLNCNGTWYQPVQSGSQSSYTVVAPPK